MIRLLRNNPLLLHFTLRRLPPTCHNLCSCMLPPQEVVVSFSSFPKNRIHTLLDALVRNALNPLSSTWRQEDIWKEL